MKWQQAQRCTQFGDIWLDAGRLSTDDQPLADKQTWYASHCGLPFHRDILPGLSCISFGSWQLA
jgi:hypothetical protein